MRKALRKNSNDVINSGFQIETKPDKLAHACSFTEVLFKMFTEARVHNLLLEDGSNELPIVIGNWNQSVELSPEGQIDISYKCCQILRENSMNPAKTGARICQACQYSHGEMERS